MCEQNLLQSNPFFYHVLAKFLDLSTLYKCTVAFKNNILKDAFVFEKREILTKRFSDSPEMFKALGGLTKLMKMRLITDYESCNIYSCKKDSKKIHNLVNGQNRPLLIILKANIIICLPIVSTFPKIKPILRKTLKNRYNFVFLLKGGWNTRKDGAKPTRFWYQVFSFDKINHSLPTKIKPSDVDKLVRGKRVKLFFDKNTKKRKVKIKN